MVDMILIAAAVVVLVALILVRRKPRNAPPPQVRTPVSPAAPEARQTGGRLAAALAANPGRPPGVQAPGAPGAGYSPAAGPSQSAPAGGQAPPGSPVPAAQAGGYPSAAAPSSISPGGSYPPMAVPSPVAPAGCYPAMGGPSPVSPAGGFSPMAAPFSASPAGSFPPAVAFPGGGMQPAAAPPPAHALESQGAPTTVLERTTGAFLEVVSGDDAGRRFPLVTGDNRIGRGPNNRLRLTDRTVSNQHAIVRMAPGQALLFDDSSTNGTYLNGQRVLQPRPLTPGDRITVGRTVLQFHLESEEAPLAG